MLSIIRAMNKSFKALAVVAIVCFSFAGCSDSEVLFDMHESPSEAIMHYLNEERGQIIDYNEIEQAILCNYNIDDRCYYLMSDICNDNDNVKDVLKVYVLELLHTGAGYLCEKATADFSFDLAGAENDEAKTPFIEYVAPTNDVFIHIGKIYNTHYNAYYNGELLELYSGGMFFYITKDADAETLIIR